MNFVYDSHGDKHFGNAGGGGKGTVWKNSKADVMNAIQTYLLSKHSDLDMLKSMEGSGNSVYFYIVDVMSALGFHNEDASVFTIQGSYATSEFSGSTVNFHMYPDNTGVNGFGIGCTKNQAITNSR